MAIRKIIPQTGYDTNFHKSMIKIYREEQPTFGVFSLAWVLFKTSKWSAVVNYDVLCFHSSVLFLEEPRQNTQGSCTEVFGFLIVDLIWHMYMYVIFNLQRQWMPLNGKPLDNGSPTAMQVVDNEN
jgi:hypothetical protein